MILTKKKVVLRCLGTFAVSCINPIAGAIVAAINIKACLDDAETDRRIKEVVTNPEFVKVCKEAGILPKE